MVRRADCFGCWETIENPALLFSPNEEVSSDNVVTRTATELCPKCYNEVFEFIMGKESPNYDSSRPTLQEALLTRKTKEDEGKWLNGDPMKESEILQQRKESPSQMNTLDNIKQDPSRKEGNKK